MDKLNAAKQLLERYEKDVEQLIQDARLEGFEEGMHCKEKVPTTKQFRQDHKTPQVYGEDYAVVVYASSRKRAAVLLRDYIDEDDVDAVDDIAISWKPFELDGEIVVGYYCEGSNLRDAGWFAYGIYL